MPTCSILGQELHEEKGVLRIETTYADNHIICGCSTLKGTIYNYVFNTSMYNTYERERKKRYVEFIPSVDISKS